MQNQYITTKENSDKQEIEEVNASQASIRTTATTRTSHLFQNQTEVAFIYDIPKKDHIFLNKSMSEFFVSKGYEGSQVQIIKGKLEDQQKPFWSGRIKFSNEAQRAKACTELKYFEMCGHQMRLLSYDQNLSRFQKLKPSQCYSCGIMPKQDCQFCGTVPKQECQPKPDNSEENCNIVVKGLDPEMTDFQLEEYFSKYGPVRNCKIAKDSISGRSKTYGFVWFEEGQHANTAMLDSKAGQTPFTMDWYKILAQRPSLKVYSEQPVFDQVCITWRKTGSDSSNILQKEDLMRYYSKFGRIVDIDFQSENNRAMIAFERCKEAEFAVSVTKIMIRNHSVWAKPMKERIPQSYNAPVNRYQSENVPPPKFDINNNLIVKNLDPSISENNLANLLGSYGNIVSFKLNRKSTSTFAYVAYPDIDTCQFALHALNGSFHFGSQLVVEQFKTQEQRMLEPNWSISQMEESSNQNGLPNSSRAPSQCSTANLKNLCSSLKGYLIQAIQKKNQNQPNSSMVQAQKILKKYMLQLDNKSQPQHQEITISMLSSPELLNKMVGFLEVYSHKLNPEEEITVSDKQFDNFHNFVVAMLKATQEKK